MKKTLSSHLPKSTENLKGTSVSSTQNASLLQPLSSKERAVLHFIETELVEKGISPSYQEICDHFGFASFNSVQNYLKQLSNKGYLSIQQNQKRAIQILHSAHDFKTDLENRLNYQNKNYSGPSMVAPLGQNANDLTSQSKVCSIPFLGKVAAGQPLERLYQDEFLDVPLDLIRGAGDYFALKVEGDSMIDEGIFDGDFLVIQSQQNAKDGDLVVASIENESTVKRFFHKKNPASESNAKQIELRPANTRLKSMWYDPSFVQIKGLVKGLLRKY